MNRAIYTLASLIILLVLTGGSFVFWKTDSLRNPSKIQETLSQREETEKTSAAEEEKTYTLFFVGDIMLHRSVEYMVHTEGKGDWTFPFRSISEYLHEADFLFGNLESVISDKGQNVGGIYSFRADPASMRALTSAGFDMVSSANNHSFDYTFLALKDSLARLREQNIQYAGAGLNREEAHSPALFQLPDDTILGVLAYTAVGSSAWQATDSTPGIAWMDASRLETLAEDIASAKEQADLVIVSFHFGEEYQEGPSSQQRILGKAAVDAGADLVVGHHPHVLQPLEQYGEGWIAWSLGNFLFDQYFSEETMRGAILKAEARDGKLLRVELIPTKQNAFYQVELEPLPSATMNAW